MKMILYVLIYCSLFSLFRGQIFFVDRLVNTAQSPKQHLSNINNNQNELLDLKIQLWIRLDFNQQQNDTSIFELLPYDNTTRLQDEQKINPYIRCALRLTDNEQDTYFTILTYTNDSQQSEKRIDINFLEEDQHNINNKQWVFFCISHSTSKNKIFIYTKFLDRTVEYTAENISHSIDYNTKSISLFQKLNRKAFIGEIYLLTLHIGKGVYREDKFELLTHIGPHQKQKCPTIFQEYGFQGEYVEQCGNFLVIKNFEQLDSIKSIYIPKGYTLYVCNNILTYKYLFLLKFNIPVFEIRDLDDYQYESIGEYHNNFDVKVFCE